MDRQWVDDIVIGVMQIALSQATIRDLVQQHEITIPNSKLRPYKLFLIVVKMIFEIFSTLKLVMPPRSGSVLFGKRLSVQQFFTNLQKKSSPDAIKDILGSQRGQQNT